MRVVEVEDVKSAKVGPFASRSLSEILRWVRVGSVAEGEFALANERNDKNIGRGEETVAAFRQRRLADFGAMAWNK